MKNKTLRLILVLICLFVAGTAFASWLEESQVRIAAAAFPSRNAVGSRALPGRALKGLNARGALWIASYEPSGYAVFSGSDLVGPVVVFSDKDYAEPSEGEPFYDVLKGASEGCQNAEAAEETSDGLRHRAKWQKLLAEKSQPRLKGTRLASGESGVVVVEPFLTSHWNQWQPYNDFAPVLAVEDDDSYRSRTPCGCVATAGAQVLNYWKWPARIDTVRQYDHTFVNPGKGSTSYSIRFDGHLPIDWASLNDTYRTYCNVVVTNWISETRYQYWTETSYDLRGVVAESERYAIARLVHWCDSLACMTFKQSGSSANFDTLLPNVPGYTGFKKYSLGTSCDDNYYNAVAKLKSEIVARRPVPINIPGHAVIGHGWMEEDDDVYVYLNYGWGGTSDNYYNLDDRSSGSQVEDIYVGFQPLKEAQVNPLPAVSPQTGVSLSWNVPKYWKNSGAITRCDVIAYATDTSALTDKIDDFSSAMGRSTDDNIAVEDGALCVNTPVSGTYTWNDRHLLTGRSVLTYDITSACSLGHTLTVEARFNDGDWTVVSKPRLLENDANPSWKTMRVFLGNHGGEMAQFRVRVAYSSGSYFYPDTMAISIDNFRVSEVYAQTATRHNVPTDSSSYWVGGLLPGTRYSFTVELTDDDGNALESGAVSTITAGNCVTPLPGTESYDNVDLVYSAAADDPTWTIDGTNPSDDSIGCYDWSGGFSIGVNGKLTTASVLSFDWTAHGYYDASSYDVLEVAFTRADGTTTTLYTYTNQLEVYTSQRVEIDLSPYVGLSGEISISFEHDGSQYVGDGYGMTFYAPKLVAVSMPVLPEAKSSARTLTYSSVQPAIQSVTHSKSAVTEGFFAECSMGGNVFNVRCSADVVSLEAHVSAASYIPDSAITVHNLGSGSFVVEVDASGVPAYAARTRAIMTLAAKDANGLTVYKDLSLRFSPETEEDDYEASSSPIVTLNANGGTVSGAATVSFPVEYGKYTSQAGANRTVSRSGYALVGWYDTSASSGGNMVFDARGYAVSGKYWNGAYSPKVSSATWKYAGSVTAYARWVATPQCRVVTFDANGGAIGNAAYAAVVVENGKYTNQAGASGTKATRSGYTLVGWYDTNAASGGNMVFNAQGHAVNGTYWNGSYVPSKSSATWKYAGSVTAYARWAQNKSTVTLNANGGTVSGAATVSFPVEYGKYTSQAGANRTVSRSGYALVGWFDTNAASGGNMVFDARGYAVNGTYWNGAYSPSVSSATWKGTGNVTAYARWVKTPPYRVVTFDANGGALGNASCNCVVEQGKYTSQAGASVMKATRSGYTLVGWYDAKSGGNMVFNAQGYAVNGTYWNGSYVPSKSSATWKYAGSVTAYARWAQNKSTVTLNANGGTVSGAATVSFPVEYGKYTSQAGANRTVSRSGYALVGWYDTSASSGGNMVFDARGYAVNGVYWNGAYSPSVSSATWKGVGNVTAYARWVKTPPYRVVTFDANGGAIGNAAYAAVVVESGRYTNQAGASGAQVTRAGYSLEGWFDTTNSVGGNMVFDARGYAVHGKFWNGAYSPKVSAATWRYAGNVVAYARWVKSPPYWVVTFDANGGKIEDSDFASVIVESGKSTMQAAASGTSVTRTDYMEYAHIGWFDTTNSVGGNMVFDASGYAVNGKYWDGTYEPGKTSAKWKFAGNVTVYARWVRRTNNNAAASVRKSAGGSSLEDGEIVAVEAPLFFQGEYEGVFADDDGRFMLTLDEGLETAYFVTWTEDGGVACECEAAVAGDVLILTTEKDEIYHLVWDEDGLVATQE